MDNLQIIKEDTLHTSILKYIEKFVNYIYNVYEYMFIFNINKNTNN